VRTKKVFLSTSATPPVFPTFSPLGTTNETPSGNFGNASDPK